jgi:transcription antitermination factor NusG
MIETLLVVRGRHVREQRPLLGDYMLTSISSGWKSLIAIRGVAGILLNDSGFPAQVLPHEMQRMRSACDGDVYRSSVIEEQGFEYNQKVSPKEGPFACHVGRYDIRTKRGDSARFWLFGREQRVTFKSGDLVAV